MPTMSIFIFQGKTTKVQKRSEPWAQKINAGFVLTNYVSIIPKPVSCPWTTITISIFQFQLIINQY